MHRLLLLVPVLLLAPAACGHSDNAPSTPAPAPAAPAAPPPPAAKPVDDEAAGRAAYDAKKFDECGRIYEQLAEKQPPRQDFHLVNAACCHALANKPDAAFAVIDRALAHGYRDVKELETDEDLVSLRKDARWTKVIVSVTDNVTKFENSVREPALRKELLARVETDQKAVKAAHVDAATKNDPKKIAEAEVVVANNTAWLKGIVAKHGWPGKTLVGEDGAHSAWLLVQHADKDLAFQKDCLAKMEAMLKTGEVGEQQYAYLYDRVAVAEKRPQRYGTQFDDHRKPHPIEDEAHVDARRAALGLPSMAEYTKQMIEMYGPPT